MKIKSKWPKLTTLQRQMKNISKKALRAGVKLIISAVRAAAPVRSGALKKSLASKVDSFKGEVTAFGIVGPRSDYLQAVGGRAVKPSRYAHLVERGRFARPFLQPSWQANKATFLAEVERVMAVEFNKITGG